MYSLTRSSLILFLLLPLSLCAQILDDPVAYNNAIVREQEKIAAANLEYSIVSVHSDDDAASERKRQTVVTQLNESIQNVQEMPPFRGDTKLRDEAEEVFKLYRETYTRELNEAALLRKNREDSYEAMEKYLKTLDRAEEKINSAMARFNDAQRKFADRHDLKITANANTDLQDKMTAVSAVNRYQREVFLIFFKVSKAEGLCMDALQNDEPKKLSALRRQLHDEAVLAISNLRRVQAHNGNTGYRDAVMDMVVYLKRLADDDFSRLADITQRKLDKKLTQEDVDDYNEIVDRYNKEHQEYLQAVSQERNKLLQENVPRD